jgi:hypothetical protein
VTLGLGISGESGLLQLAAIKEYLTSYRPGVVLWCFFEGVDLGDLYRESMEPLDMQYLEPDFSQHLIARQAEIDAAWRHAIDTAPRRAAPVRHTVMYSLAASLKLWGLREKWSLMSGNVASENQFLAAFDAGKQNVLRDVLAQGNRIVAGWGGRLYLVYLPNWHRYRNRRAPFDRAHAGVLNLANSLGISVIDTEPTFAAQPDPLAMFGAKKFGHYSEAGNQAIADTVLRELGEPRLVSR